METVGQILRAEREKQNLTVKDVERATSIRALYITSIEEDKYKVIPGEVYLKGFIRNYANFLGLNGPELVNLYRESQQPEEPVAPEKPVAPPTLPTENKSLAFKVPPKAAAAAILVVAALGIGVWAYQGTGKAPTAPEAKVQQQAAVPAPSATPAAPEKQPQSKPVMVQAKYTAECWTQVMADGKQIYEGTPKVNESLTWEAEKTISIKAGNAGAIDVSINGEPQGKLGNKGEVVVKTFTPTGVKK